MQNEKKDPYKEGEVVTWKFNDKLIIKTELGQRRKHIQTMSDRGEEEFYRPHLEHYIGQFSIDYQPKKYEMLTQDQANQITPYKREASKWLEFNLMLNDSWVEATDESIDSLKALDHQDQVKIKVEWFNKSISPYNTKHFFEQEDMKRLDKNSKHDIYGLTCYNFNHGRGKRCLGKSSNNKISGFNVLILPENNISVRYHEFSYGGISIKYILHPSNLNQINKIDQAIWRLLDTWNVSPYQSY